MTGSAGLSARMPLACAYLRNRVKIKYSTFATCRQQRVVPIAVELVTLETERSQLLVADLGASGIARGIGSGAFFLESSGFSLPSPTFLCLSFSQLPKSLISC